jgi:hypothetical protein
MLTVNNIILNTFNGNILSKRRHKRFNIKLIYNYLLFGLTKCTSINYYIEKHLSRTVFGKYYMFLNKPLKLITFETISNYFNIEL